MSYFQIIKKYWYFIVIVVILTTCLSFVISVFQTAKYKSQVKLLVIQKQGGRMDAYTAARSAETIASILAKMVYTSTFFDKVISSDFDIKDDFGVNPEERKKNWKKQVDVRTIESGTIEISVYDEDQYQAEQIALAVAYTMINEARIYHGGEAQIEVKLVDKPLTSTKPVRPNIPLNTLAGFGLGLLASCSILFLMVTAPSKRQKPEGKVFPKMPEKEPESFLPSKEERLPQKEPRLEFAPKLKKPIFVQKEKGGEERKDFFASEPRKEYSRGLEIGKRIGDRVSERLKEAQIKKEALSIAQEKEKEKKKEWVRDAYSPERVEEWLKTGRFSPSKKEKKEEEK